MAEIIITGLEGLPASLTVLATQYQQSANKKKQYGRLTMMVGHSSGSGRRFQYTHSSMYMKESMDDAISVFQMEWRDTEVMIVRDNIIIFGADTPTAPPSPLFRAVSPSERM